MQRSISSVIILIIFLFGHYGNRDIKSVVQLLLSGLGDAQAVALIDDTRALRN
jgi:hypothetical protein